MTLYNEAVLSCIFGMDVIIKLEILLRSVLLKTVRQWTCSL